MSVRSWIVTCGAVGAMVAACSGGPASASGSVGGIPVQVGDAVFGVPSGSTTGTVVAITSFGAICSKFTNNVNFKGPATALVIELVQNGAPVTSPGTFPFVTAAPQGSTTAFAGSFDSWDATCTSTNTQVTGGTVTVSAVSSSALAGSFDLMFGNDHVTGSFNAPNCAALGQTGNSSTCQ